MPKSSGVVVYAESQQGLKTRLLHGPSEEILITDAPKDNGGSGTFFSPTDLVGAAVASCALTLMAIAAQRNNIPWTGAKITTAKQMVADPFRRIGELNLEIRMPNGFNANQRAILEKAAHTCPVVKSLHPDVKLAMNFLYNG